MSAFNEFVEFVAKIITQPLSKKNTTLSEHTPSQSPEGKMVAKNIKWHKENSTYTSSYIIDAIIVTVDILTLAEDLELCRRMCKSHFVKKSESIKSIKT